MRDSLTGLSSEWVFEAMPGDSPLVAGLWSDVSGGLCLCYAFLCFLLSLFVALSLWLSRRCFCLHVRRPKPTALAVFAPLCKV